jgi:hypothetical protein
MGEWQRISPPEAHRQLAKRNAVVLGAIGLALIGLSFSLGRVPQAVFLLLFVAIAGVVMALNARAGIQAGPDGLRLRRVLATRDLPWSGIADIATAPAQHLGADTSYSALWIVTTADERLETRVVRYDHLPQGERVNSRRWLKLGPAEFDGVAQELRDATRQAQKQPGSATPAQEQPGSAEAAQ